MLAHAESAQPSKPAIADDPAQQFVQKAIEAYQPMPLQRSTALDGITVWIVTNTQDRLSPERGIAVPRGSHFCAAFPAMYLYHMVLQAGGTPRIIHHEFRGCGCGAMRTPFQSEPLRLNPGSREMIVAIFCNAYAHRCASMPFARLDINSPRVCDERDLAVLPDRAEDDFVAPLHAYRVRLGAPHCSDICEWLQQNLSSAHENHLCCAVSVPHFRIDPPNGRTLSHEIAGSIFGEVLYLAAGIPKPDATESKPPTPQPYQPVGTYISSMLKKAKRIQPGTITSADEATSFCRKLLAELVRPTSLVYARASVVRDGDTYTLVGSTNHAALRQPLRVALKTVCPEGTQVGSGIRVLPDRGRLGTKIYGICTASSVISHTRPNTASGPQSELLYGEAVFVLDRKNSMLLVQGGDGYWGWVPEKAIRRVEKALFRSYMQRRPIALKETLRDDDVLIPGGAVLRLATAKASDDMATIALPTGEQTSVNRELVREVGLSPAQIEAQLKAALDLLYVPYLYGGRSPQGLDCSGLMTNIYAQTGMTIARDAWMQSLSGMLVATPADRSNLRAGDQVFFINPTGKISHTGLMLDATHVIHARAPGVKIGSIDKSDRLYDERLDREFFIAKRR